MGDNEQNLGREVSELKTELREYRLQNGDRLNRFENSNSERFTRLENALNALKDEVNKSMTLMEKAETESLIEVGIQQDIEKKRKEADRKRQMLGWYAAGFVGFIEIVDHFWEYISRAARHIFGN